MIELNEAFASQALACMRQLGLPDDAEHVNPNGGAIALGHPLGMSGARLAMTAAHQLDKIGGKRALATMCVGVGQGVSLGDRDGFKPSVAGPAMRSIARAGDRRHHQRVRTLHRLWSCDSAARRCAALPE